MQRKSVKEIIKAKLKQYGIEKPEPSSEKVMMELHTAAKIQNINSKSAAQRFKSPTLLGNKFKVNSKTTASQPVAQTAVKTTPVTAKSKGFTRTPTAISRLAR